MPEINTTSTMVTECSWLPGGWQWSAAGPNGMTMGAASSEQEAWEKARAAVQTLGIVPRGNG